MDWGFALTIGVGIAIGEILLRLSRVIGRAARRRYFPQEWFIGNITVACDGNKHGDCERYYNHESIRGTHLACACPCHQENIIRA